MADDPHGGRGYPPRDNNPDQRQQDQQQQSSYPPLDEDDRRLPPVAPMTLPSLSHTVPDGRYPPPPEQRYPGGYPEQPRHPEYPPPPADPRYAAPGYSNGQRSWSSESPTNPNGYPPPGPGERFQLPPVHAPGPDDRSRYDDRARYDERRGAYDDRSRYDDRRPYEDRRYAEPYYPNQPGPARGGYGAPPDPYYPGRYGGYPYGPDYRGGAPPPAPVVAQPQAAPRQRTSIACRYCRKRKIRCSGYANTNNGKCTNCDKLRIDCVFQPVSSNSGTAFVPISAVPGGASGLAPGTLLYGSYGQPLPQTTGGQSQSGQSQSQRPYGGGSDYAPSLHSPTSQYAASYDDRSETNRRRPRPAEEEHPNRLPPPNYPPDDNPRRRSPTNSNGTPPTAYHQYQPGYEQDRIPTPHRNSPGNAAAIPTPSPSQQSQAPSSTTSNPMSLSSMVANDPRDRNKEGAGPNGSSNGSNGTNSNIDRDMLGRLNPPRRG